MNTPLVSVIITAYNRELYIKEAIESVLNSTYNNLELIIVDDCSVDNTYFIAKSFEKKDNRVSVYLNSKNIGDYPNRNKAAGYATGKYLKYVDSDDYIFPHTIEDMVEIMEKNTSAVLGISTRKNSSIKLFSPLEAYTCHFFQYGLLDYGPSACIIKKNIFEKENGYKEIRNVSDMDLWLRIASKYNVLEIPSGMIYWREHNLQESKIARDYYIEFTYSIIKEHLLSVFCPLSKESIFILLLKYKKQNAKSIIKYFLRTGNFKLSFQFWKDNNHQLIDLF